MCIRDRYYFICYNYCFINRYELTQLKSNIHGVFDFDNYGNINCHDNCYDNCYDNGIINCNIKPEQYNIVNCFIYGINKCKFECNINSHILSIIYCIFECDFVWYDFSINYDFIHCYVFVIVNCYIIWHIIAVFNSIFISDIN